MKTLSELLGQQSSGHLFHYTDAAGAIGILCNKNIRASSIRHLNDSSEYHLGRDWLRNEIKRRSKSPASEALQKALSDDKNTPSIPTAWDRATEAFELAVQVLPVYVASFSEEPDLLSQWRAYSGSNGYAIEFDASSYLSHPWAGLKLVRCVYSKEDKEELCTALLESFTEEMSDVIPGQEKLHVALRCARVMAMIKHVGFAEEKEWRLVGHAMSLKRSYRTGRHGIVPYVEVPVQEMGMLQMTSVWLGPNSDQDAALDAIQGLVLQSGFANITFSKSDTTYRD